MVEPQEMVSPDQAPLTVEEYGVVQEILRSLQTDEERAFCDYRCARRYARAHKFKLEKALEGVRKTVAWRREFGVDQLLERDMEVLKRQGQVGKVLSVGTDKAGHPIITMHPVREDLYDHDGSLKLLVFTMERSVGRMRGGVEKLVMAIDFVGYTVSNAPPFKTSRATLDIVQNHYPERLHRAFMWQPMWAFSMFWKVISPFIDPVTYAKVVMLKESDPAERTKRLLEHIEPHELTTEFGGEHHGPFKGNAMEQYWEEAVHALREKRAAEAAAAAAGGGAAAGAAADAAAGAAAAAPADDAAKSNVDEAGF